MSSIPGYTLEKFLAWQFNLVVEEQGENNVSLGMAEMFGNIKSRPRVTADQFTPIVELYEPYREIIEYRLGEFDDENQSWRDYAQYVDDNVPNEVIKKAEDLIKELTCTTTSV